MPTIGASIAASLVAWTIDDLLAPVANLPIRLLVNLVVSVFVFYAVRRYLIELRGR
jgi:hypothetical protein